MIHIPTPIRIDDGVACIERKIIPEIDGTHHTVLHPARYERIEHVAVCPSRQAENLVLDVDLPEDAEHRHNIGVVDAEHKNARFCVVIVAREMPNMRPSRELINQERVRKRLLEYRVAIKPNQNFWLIS